MARNDSTAQAAAAAVAVNPLMNAAKQERILIWRTEVASALSLPTSSHSSDTTTTSIASPSAEDMDDAGPNPEIGSPLTPSSSKARGFWKRISWRFRKHSLSLGPDSQRTSMYRNDRPKALPEDAPIDDNGAIADRYSDEGGVNGLREKQERLERAAKLLNKGISTSNNRHDQITTP